MIRLFLISALALGYLNAFCCCDDWGCELFAVEGNNEEPGCCASVPKGCEGQCESQFCGDRGESFGIASAVVSGERTLVSARALEKEGPVAVPFRDFHTVEWATVPVKAAGAPLYQVHCVYLL